MKLTKNFFKTGISLSVLFVGGIIWFLSQGNEPGEKELVNNKGDGVAQLESLSFEKGLAIIPNKCIGCGKCAHLAPDNFIMNATSHKAEIILQENLENENIKRAIDACPTSAITI